MIGHHAALRFAIALPLMGGIAGCTAIPTPASAPPPAAVRPAPPPPAPASVAVPGWEDRALTPGDWRYDATRRTASYGIAGGQSLASIGCEGSRITLTVPGLTTANEATLRTTAGNDALALDNGSVRMAAQDPRLDRIIFSRGRFAIEDAAGRALTLPSWPEIGRVVDDCRG